MHGDRQALRGHLSGDGTPEEIYEVTYCMRAQAENLIKLHKSQLSSDRLPCADAVANQLRLVVYSTAYIARECPDRC